MESFQQRFRALWQRELTDYENQLIRSFSLCESFMGLESIDRGLQYAIEQEQADEQFSYMVKIVKQRAETVTTLLYKFARKTRWTDASAFPDLLSWELAILDDLRPKASL